MNFPIKISIDPEFFGYIAWKAFCTSCGNRGYFIEYLDTPIVISCVHCFDETGIMKKMELTKMELKLEEQEWNPSNMSKSK